MMAGDASGIVDHPYIRGGARVAERLLESNQQCVRFYISYRACHALVVLQYRSLRQPNQGG